jgi:hypothetical protein
MFSTETLTSFPMVLLIQLEWLAPFTGHSRLSINYLRWCLINVVSLCCFSIPVITYSPHAFNGAFLESMEHALTNVTLQLILVPSMVPFQNIDNITPPSSIPLMVPFNIITLNTFIHNIIT